MAHAVTRGAGAGLAGLLLLTWSCAQRVLGYEVVTSYPHDSSAYTQGLLWHEGKLYESTGRQGTSSIRRVDLETGEVEAQTLLPAETFGEGLAFLNGELYQLSWHAGECRVYDLEDLRLDRTLRYEGEGWGLTAIEGQLVMTDGTDLLSYRDPKDFGEVRRVRVKDHHAEEGQEKITRINELEYITSGRYAGELWANIWKQFRIARIDPRTGKVKGWIDLTGIFDPRGIRDQDAVLNGIAFDPEKERIFVTGKLWPRLFQIKPRAR